MKLQIVINDRIREKRIKKVACDLLAVETGDETCVSQVLKNLILLNVNIISALSTLVHAAKGEDRKNIVEDMLHCVFKAVLEDSL